MSDLPEIALPFVLPTALVQRMMLFMQNGRDGQIALNFRNGEIHSWDVKEHEYPSHRQGAGTLPLT